MAPPPAGPPALPGSIWAKLIEEQTSSSRKPDKRADAFVYVVGNRGAGKTTLLNRYLYPSKAEAPKPSEGLEYVFARRPGTFDLEHKDTAHIWELGGGEAFMERVLASDQLFLNYRQVTSAVVVVAVDLSDPASAPAAAASWLARTTAKLAATYALFERKGLTLPQQLRQRARTKLWAGHPDGEVVAHSGISLVLVGTKYDAFVSVADAEAQRVVSGALRALAHAHGAHLLFTGGLHPGGGGGAEGGGSSAGACGGQGPPAVAGKILRAQMEEFGRLMGHLLFGAAERKMPLRQGPQTDPMRPLLVPATYDRLADIGRPNGSAWVPPSGPSATSTPGHAGYAGVAALVEDWRRAAAERLPQGKPAAAAAAAEQSSQAAAAAASAPCYADEAVDAVRALKQEQLAAFRRQQEALRVEAAVARRAAAPVAKQPGQQQRLQAARGSPAGQLQARGGS